MKKFEGMMLACDLDGTLLDSERRISPANEKALRYFVGEGGRFTLATGRAPSAIQAYLDQLPFNAPYSLLNGSLILNEQHQVLHCAGMPAETRKMIQTALEKFPALCCEIYLGDKILIQQMNAVSTIHMQILNVDYILASQEEAGDTSHWCKINFTGMPPLMEQLNAFLAPYQNRFAMAASLPVFCEVTTAGVHKGAALQWIARQCQIRPECVFAVGDSYNDETMLRAAQTCFVPANAEEGIRAIADVVCTRSNDEDAVAEVIDYLSGHVA